MIKDPDAELMLRVKSGDMAAFQILFDKYKNRMLNFCYRYCGHHSISEELTQEVFLRIFKAASHYRPTARFSTWLYRIATNVCLNELRKREYRMKIDSLDQLEGETLPGITEDRETPTPETHLQERERERHIQQALTGLPDKQRAALLLRLEGGFRYREIAEQMDCTESHVKVLIHRGRKQLKKKLQPILGETL
jgi:RNA polymerase sigma-70 factor, ECF subfamily